MQRNSISKATQTARLFSKDQTHVDRMVKEFKATDIKFKDRTSAIRHYVRLGIASENRVEHAHSLDGKIVKATQKEVIAESLNPVKDSLDKLIQVMEQFGEKQDTFLASISRQYNLLEKQISTFTGNINSNNTNNYAEEILRCIYVLRTIMTVYLLAYHPNIKNPTGLTNWQDAMKELNVKANGIAFHEISGLSGKVIDDKIIGDLTNEFWRIIKRNTSG